MLKRNAPLLAFLLVFVAVLYFVYSIPQYEPIVDAEEEEEVVEDAFVGRVEMPSIDEIYVIENSAGRDLNKLALFLEGRAAGLHYLSSEYFKKIRVARKGGRFIKSDDDVFLGLHLTLDSLGRFMDPQIMFTSSDNDVFKVKLLKHVEYFWRLPPSKQGKLEIWIPIRFHAN
ncbi:MULTISPECIES: hypothetical protein [unclassified Fibrobacter]|uniref:hypothetical protein n=1 Tax=unclassified Fibrobacter TaxID=2634177 RepID=UPI00091EDC0D|nr:MULTISPECIES: hypothetical protein [unclassified Fibrobacter]SHK74516.1 hypothetical protein SAMN05720759_10618 [Fibrobacter sp. UWB12]SIO37540.1 hypothetical protein SAMN05720758_2486 [Fibrobacter sp. UWB11]